MIKVKYPMEETLIRYAVRTVVIKDNPADYPVKIRHYIVHIDEENGVIDIADREYLDEGSAWDMIRELQRSNQATDTLPENPRPLGRAE